MVKNNTEKIQQNRKIKETEWWQSVKNKIELI